MPKLPPFSSSTDRTPRYSVKDVADMLNLSAHTIRFYENNGLIPGVDRTTGNIRKFSEYALSWLRLVYCLRETGLPIESIKRYIQLCQEGDATIAERAEMIFKQEENLRRQLQRLRQQMDVLRYKKKFYKGLLEGKKVDSCNPATHPDTVAPPAPKHTP